MFVNIGMTLIIIITLLATTGRENMHSASYIFTQTYNCESGCFSLVRCTSRILHRQTPVGRITALPSCLVFSRYNGR